MVFLSHTDFVRNKQEGGVMIYIRETISSKILDKHSCPNVRIGKILCNALLFLCRNLQQVKPRRSCCKCKNC